ncbi:MAG: hypothetical protein QOG50_696 [Actinomycetota bacterium]|nr:hypothetical protein [Actinomycetota bacterium]
MTEANEWYWCLEHKVAETASGGCPPDRRLGPYPSREAAEHWKEQVEARNQAWEAEDEEWSGESA